MATNVAGQYGDCPPEPPKCPQTWGDRFGVYDWIPRFLLIPGMTVAEFVILGILMSSVFNGVRFDQIFTNTPAAGLQTAVDPNFVAFYFAWFYPLGFLLLSIYSVLWAPEVAVGNTWGGWFIGLGAPIIGALWIWFILARHYLIVVMSSIVLLVLVVITVILYVIILTRKTSDSNPLRELILGRIWLNWMTWGLLYELFIHGIQAVNYLAPIPLATQISITVSCFFLINAAQALLLFNINDPNAWWVSLTYFILLWIRQGAVPQITIPAIIIFSVHTVLYFTWLFVLFWYRSEGSFRKMYTSIADGTALTGTSQAQFKSKRDLVAV